MSVGHVLLGVLAEGPAHGYDLKHAHDERYPGAKQLAFGQVYAALARLEKDGFVEVIETTRGAGPDRTTYALTPAGPPALAEWVSAHLSRTDGAASFRVALAEAHNLSRTEVAAQLATRRAGLAEEYEALRIGLQSARARETAGQFMVEVERHLHLLGAELEWTDSFLARLANEDYLWGVADLSPAQIAHHQELRKAAQK
jgi:DNA-binding PadR family transcriptional regulator